MNKKSVKLGKQHISEINFDSIAKGLIYGSAVSDKIANFRYSHCKRVSNICLHLAEWEDISLERCLCMGIIHDAHKYISNETEHGILASNFLKSIFKEYYPKKKKISGPEINELNAWKDVIEALKYHSNKNPEGKLNKALKDNKYYKVICDADILDHISVEYVTFFSSEWRDGKYDETALEMVKEVLPYKGKSAGYDKIKNEKIDALLSSIKSEDIKTAIKLFR